MYINNNFLSEKKKIESIRYDYQSISVLVTIILPCVSILFLSIELMTQLITLGSS